MHYRCRQSGMSFVGLVFVLVILAFVGLIGLKLFPIYMESFKIDKAMKSVVADTSLAGQSKALIGRALTKRLDIDNVDQITEHNYKQYVTITKKGGKLSMDTKYRAEAHLFGNIGVVVDFEKHAEN